MKRSEVAKFLIIRTIGNFLVLLMIFGFLATFGPAVYYEVHYKFEKWQGVTYKIANAQSNVYSAQSDITSEQNSLSSLFVGSHEKILIPKSTEFSIVIPKIGITEKIIPNTDPYNSEEFLEVLKQGVAHAKGSALPASNGTTYLFAHSTDNFWNVGRYNALFYLIKELEPRDEIVVFYNDKRYEYEVSEKKIIDATDLSYLTQVYDHGERLVLQTCWPPGTTWKRLLIIARPKN